MFTSLQPLTTMQPTLVRTAFHRERWIYETKYDGWRILAYKSGQTVQLISRTGRDHTERFPEVAEAVRSLPARRLILDGELCVFDQSLRSRFDLLGNPDESIPTTPPVLIAFDVLGLGSRDLRMEPLRARREALEHEVAGSDVLLARRLADDGLKAWQEVLAHGWEGLVAKDPESRYHGGPTRSWLKVKVRREGRFLIGGVVERDEGWSLLLGSVESGRLSYRGLVHWGVGRRLAEALTSNGLVRSTSPFPERVPLRGVTWLEPRLMAEVTYAEVTKGGLRAPVFRGLAAPLGSLELPGSPPSRWAVRASDR